MRSYVNFNKSSDYLICFDSDGCVIDTMDIKHSLCFGPQMIRAWRLESWNYEILDRWKEINLYTITRGINRFKGLATALMEINEKYTPIEGVEKLYDWAYSSPELSDSSLGRIILQKPNDGIFKKALEWSKAVNYDIDNLPIESKLPFPMVKEALAAASERADLAIISSANADAIIDEWQTHGIMKYINVMMSQADGSKAFCLERLISKGYDKNRVIMCGDSPGDMKAAEKCGVHFYPIIVGREEKCWSEFTSEALGRFFDGCYGGKYEEQKKKEFLKNLNA